MLRLGRRHDCRDLYGDDVRDRPLDVFVEVGIVNLKVKRFTRPGRGPVAPVVVETMTPYATGGLTCPTS
ncbi:hypothetical protein EVAR_17407_1 [Eumeta japonica]|uniref:Uncharacterized protein n=1 Tax=Eumeta variegata TaxID=151549 RepID=A0A4C1VA53_EUMVA|nr:hypothetical protein EVAR_17407_1 [Eumeta japonica]